MSATSLDNGAGPHFESFSLKTALNHISDVSPRKQAVRIFREAFLAAVKERLDSKAFDNPEDAQRWLISMILLYYEKKNAARVASSYALSPKAFFENCTYLENPTTMWEEPSQPRAESEWKAAERRDEQRAAELVQAIPRIDKTAPTASGGFTLVSVGELLQQPFTPADYLWEDRLVVGTVSCIAAKPKVGKSTFARNLAIAVSRGQPFLGAATKQGAIIYLALEERLEDVRNDFKAMGATGNEPINIHAAHAPEAAVQELVSLLQNHRPALVVIDPLFRLARIKDEKAYAETYQALGPLIDVARESGTHILLTHHAGKSLKADAVDAPLGSTALGGIASTLIVLRSRGEGRTLETVQRIGNNLPETVLTFDSTTRTVALGSTKMEAEQVDGEQRILVYLDEVGEPQTQEQIREGVEGRTKIIRAALTSLTLAGKVRQSGDGKRGNPFLYEKWFPGSFPILGTKEPETTNTADVHTPPTIKGGSQNLLVHSGFSGSRSDEGELTSTHEKVTHNTKGSPLPNGFEEKRTIGRRRVIFSVDNIEAARDVSAIQPQQADQVESERANDDGQSQGGKCGTIADLVKTRGEVWSEPDFVEGPGISRLRAGRRRF